MPTYKYTCNACSHLFGRFLDRPQEVVPCLRCGKLEARRSLSVPKVQTSSKNGLVPDVTKTGVTSVDYDMDLAIGRSSQQGWALIEKRQDRKQELLANSPEGTTGKNISRTPDNEYVVSSNERRDRILSSQERMRPLINGAVEKARRSHGTWDTSGSKEWKIGED